MRAVVLLDRSFARRERELIVRLEVGLADEGLRLIHAVPRAILDSETVGLYSARIGYDDRGFPTTSAARIRQLTSAIEDLTETSDTPGVDVVHAMGSSCLRLAVELASAMNAAPILEVWQTASISPAMEAARMSKAPVTLLFPDSTLKQEAADAADRLDVHEHEALWGVHPHETRRESAKDLHDELAPTAPSVALLTDCSNMQALERALAGLAEAARNMPDLLIFVDSERAGAAKLWKIARRLGLLDRLTIIPGMEARREPTLRLGALLVPEASGRMRSIVLDAMSRGVPVIATRDPSLSVLSDARVACLVETQTAAAWADAIVHVVPDGEVRRALTDSARAFIRAKRPASAHVAAVLRAYETAAARRGAGVSAA